MGRGTEQTGKDPARCLLAPCPVALLPPGCAGVLAATQGTHGVSFLPSPHCEMEETAPFINL